MRKGTSQTSEARSPCVVSSSPAWDDLGPFQSGPTDFPQQPPVPRSVDWLSVDTSVLAVIDGESYRLLTCAITTQLGHRPTPSAALGG
jgi:hypothetical protein